MLNLFKKNTSTTKNISTIKYIAVNFETGATFDRLDEALRYIERLEDEYRGVFVTYLDSHSAKIKKPRLNVRSFRVYGSDFTQKSFFLKLYAKAVANGEGRAWLKEYKDHIDSL